MSKIYTRVNWVNSPSTDTPVNATNLNSMDKAIDDLDDKVVELEDGQITVSVVDTNTVRLTY